MGSAGSSFGRAVLAGTVAAIVLIAVAVAYLFATGGFPATRAAGSDDVILTLVLPDEDGVSVPRTITRYVAGIPAALHIDPLTPARIPGTSYETLRDAYSFGGGAGLARTVGEATPAPPGVELASSGPSYVLVDRDAWLALAATAGGSPRLSVVVPEHMEVFDGSRVYTFAQGANTVDPSEVYALFNGAEYLPEGDRESLRLQLSTELARLLTQAPDAFGAVDTDLNAEEFEKWLVTALEE